MTITVPSAGISAGRAAQVRLEAPDTGATIAGLGERMLQMGQALEKERLDRQLARSRLDMMKGLNGLRLEAEQSGDPDGIGPAFEAGATELRDTILGSLDPRVREDGALIFDELSYGHMANVGARAISLRQSQARAILDETETTVVATGGLSDPQTQADYLAEYDRSVDVLVANGTLTPEEAGQRRRAVREGLDTTAMTRLLSENPDSLVAGIDAGVIGGNLEGPARESWRARAVGASAERAARAGVEATRAEAARLDAAADLFRDGIAVTRKGQPFARFGEAVTALADPAIAALPEAREYAHAVALAQTMPGFNVASLTDKRAMLAAAKAAPKEKGYEADVVPAMEAAITAHEAGLKDDFYGYAEAIGLTPVAPMADPTAPGADLVASLTARAREARALGQTQVAGGKPVPFFRPAERDAWKAAVGPDVAPADRLRVAEAIAALPRADAERAMAEIASDPVFGHIGTGMAALALPRPTALAVFEGERVIARGDVKLPPVAERRNAFFQEFSALLSDGTGPTEFDETTERDALIAAADALYAYRMRGTDTDGSYDAATWNQALHEVAGGSGTYDGSTADGGVQSLSNAQGSYAVFLPKGVNATQVETALDVMTENFGAAAAVADAPGWSARIEGYWRELSADGRVPSLGGKPVDAATLRRMRLVSVGGTKFRLEATDEKSAAPVALVDATGDPIFLDMTKLLRRYGGAP